MATDSKGQREQTAAELFAIEICTLITMNSDPIVVIPAEMKHEFAKRFIRAAEAYSQSVAEPLTGEELGPVIWDSDTEWRDLDKHDRLAPEADWGEWIGNTIVEFLKKRGAWSTDFRRIAKKIVDWVKEYHDSGGEIGHPANNGVTVIASLLRGELSVAVSPEAIVIDEINSSTGPTGGWLDSPKAVCAAIVARLKGGAATTSNSAEPTEPSVTPWDFNTWGFYCDHCKCFFDLVNDGRVEVDAEHNSTIWHRKCETSARYIGYRRDDNYVAYLSYRTRNGHRDGGVHVVDSDSPGAFKVYRVPGMAQGAAEPPSQPEIAIIACGRCRKRLICQDCDGQCATWNAAGTFLCSLSKGHKGDHRALAFGRLCDSWAGAPLDTDGDALTGKEERAPTEPTCTKCNKPKFLPTTTICSAMVGRTQEFYCSCGEEVPNAQLTVGSQSAVTGEHRAVETSAGVVNSVGANLWPPKESQ